jgi:hypothetical protein
MNSTYDVEKDIENDFIKNNPNANA